MTYSSSKYPSYRRQRSRSRGRSGCSRRQDGHFSGYRRTPSPRRPRFYRSRSRSMSYRSRQKSRSYRRSRSRSRVPRSRCLSRSRERSRSRRTSIARNSGTTAVQEPDFPELWGTYMTAEMISQMEAWRVEAEQHFDFGLLSKSKVNIAKDNRKRSRDEQEMIPPAKRQRMSCHPPTIHINSDMSRKIT